VTGSGGPQTLPSWPIRPVRRAPSSGNSQPWDFVVVTDRAQLAELSKVWRSAGVRYDLGQATMAMMLAAADLGIGSGHASVADQDLARRVLGTPEDRYCAYLIALGYPADRPLTTIRRPDRRPFEDVVHWDRW
jgi:nitroreductase